MLSPLAMVLAFTWVGLIWNVLGVILLVVSVMLIAIILIQDSKGAGLTSAFGAGPGGESLLGARMQKDVARYTAWIAFFFSAIVLAMGLLGTYEREHSSAAATGANAAPANPEPGAPTSDAGLPGATPPGSIPSGATATGGAGTSPTVGTSTTAPTPAAAPSTPATPAAGAPAVPPEKGSAEKSTEKK